MEYSIKQIINGKREVLTKNIFFNIRHKDSNFWEEEGRKKVISLFKTAAKNIPAYKNFMEKNKILPQKINNWEDFQKIPAVSKKNYLKKYRLEELCWDGSFRDKSLVFTATSGSTGKPFYFPRDERLDWQSSVMHQMFLRNDTGNIDKSTLVIVGFGMGVWIGGLITYQAFRNISKGDYNLSVITPGTNKKEIYESILNLKNKFDQILLTGYPPFIKDVIDEAKLHGIDWKKLNLKIIFAAESFSEEFRDYIVKKTGIENLYTDTMNIYGSADLGTMAEETPLSIFIRRTANKNKDIFKAMFKDINRLPTLAQFNPLFVNFEEKEGEILCTADNALPVIRYAIGDQGGVMTFSEIEKIFKKYNLDLRKEARKLGFEKTISELPFVYIYERSDLSTKLYGAIIYPEHIKGALQEENISKFLTGRFTMLTKTNELHDEYLEINLELRPNTPETMNLSHKTRDEIVKHLIEKNAEYNYLITMMPGKVDPVIVLWKYQDPVFFKEGIKQKWVINK